MGDGWVPHPKQLEAIQKAEQAAQLRQARARARDSGEDYEPEGEGRDLGHRLRQGWRTALTRLRPARSGATRRP